MISRHVLGIAVTRQERGIDTFGIGSYILHIQWSGAGDSRFEFIAATHHSFRKTQIAIFESFIEILEFFIIRVNRYSVCTKICIYQFTRYPGRAVLVNHTAGK